MSYQNALEKGKAPHIEMPPLPEETPAPQQYTQQLDMHPELAREIGQPVVQQEPEIESQEEIQEQPVAQPLESKNERNIRILREKAMRAEKLEQERNELAKRLQEIENSHKAPQQQEEEYNLAPDDLVDAKYLKKYDKTINELRSELQSYKQQSNLSATEARLKARFPDLDKVVTQENLEVLRADYPEIADTITANTDLYSKAVSAYTLIKKLGISTEDLYVEDKLRAQKNAAKPKSMASIAPQQGESPLSKANAFASGLTDDLKAQLRKEMEEARRAL